MNAVDEACMLRRPSSLFWCGSVTALSCLEISSVTLTPMSSPESNMSGGLLTPPPAKPPLHPPKPSEGCSIPRPRVKLLSCLSPPAVCLPFSFFLLLLLHLVFIWNEGAVFISFSSTESFRWLLVQAGSLSMKPQSTDIFDMVPFSPVTPLVPALASNGCPPPPPTTLPPDISKYCNHYLLVVCPWVADI